jgi:hypothetical protein
MLRSGSWACAREGGESYDEEHRVCRKSLKETGCEEDWTVTPH